jgi:hypothetical protein
MMRWGYVGKLSVAVLWATACGGVAATGVGGESHFACEDDSDCARFEETPICVHHLCESKASALSAARDRSGAGGATNARGDATDGGIAPNSMSDAAAVDMASNGGSASPGSGGWTSRDAGSATPPPVEAGMQKTNYVLGGPTADGRVIAAYWNGSAEGVDLIDPVTEQATFVGYLGDLYMWSDQLAYDPNANVVYAEGQRSGGDPSYHLYNLSLDTGASTPPRDLDRSHTFGGVAADGRVIVLYWTGSSQVVGLIDPSTGTGADVGIVTGDIGAFRNWTGHVIYNRSTHVLTALGNDGTPRVDGGANLTYFYNFSLDTKTVSTSPEVMYDYVLGGFAAGDMMIGAFWNGVAEEVDRIDPVTAAHAQLGTFEGLQTWGSHGMVYIPSAHLIFAVGQDGAGAQRFFKVSW